MRFFNAEIARDSKDRRNLDNLKTCDLCIPSASSALKGLDEALGREP